MKAKLIQAGIAALIAIAGVIAGNQTAEETKACEPCSVCAQVSE